MTMRYALICTAAVLATAAWTGNAHALTMKECSAKYKAAQSAGTLKGMKWNDFRKSECAAEAPGAATSGAAPAAEAKPPAAPSPAGEAVYPTAVSPKYSSEPAGRARMHTCRDQYNANKTSNANGGLTWIKKGGGYYSECNKRLKG